MKLKDIDELLLKELYHNCRISYSKLSRNLKVSRRQVEYKVSNFIKTGIIRSFFTVYNYKKLGFNQLAYAFIKFNKKISDEKINNLLEKSKRCISWGLALSSYDIFSNWIFKDYAEAKFYFNKLNKLDIVEEINLIFPDEAIYFPLKQINFNSEEVFYLKNNSKKVKLDLIDKIILKKISNNSRISFVDLIKGLNITAEACLYRLKKLKEKEIILGFRIQFDLIKSDYFSTLLFLKLITQIQFEKIKIYCRKSKNINYFISYENNSKLIVQVFHKNELELREIILEIGDYVQKIDVVLLKDDFGIINPLPFW